jgi:hypothetical protein
MNNSSLPANVSDGIAVRWVTWRYLDDIPRCFGLAHRYPKSRSSYTLDRNVLLPLPSPYPLNLVIP